MEAQDADAPPCDGINLSMARMPAQHSELLETLPEGPTCCSASAMRGVWGADWVTGAAAAAPRTGNRGLAAATLLGDTSARRDVHG